MFFEKFCHLQLMQLFRLSNILWDLRMYRMLSSWNSGQRCQGNLNVFIIIKGFRGKKKNIVVVQMVKNLTATQETQVRSLGWEDPL